jgi:heat shock protein HslJ
MALLSSLALIIALPAHVEASQRKKHKSKAKTAPVAALSQPTPALTFSGTYSVSRLMGRPVRDADLAATRINFLPRNQVSGETACNGFTARLHTAMASRKILGFDTITSTKMACPRDQSQAEATTLRLLAETANIARAGNSLTLFNATGIAIAQLNAIVPEATKLANRSPSSPSPIRRIDFGDYILSELDGVPVGARVSASIMPRPVYPPNTRFVSILPSLYLRENGAVTGTSGCNQFTSTLVIGLNDAPSFAPLATTRKACLDPTTQRMERQFLNAFGVTQRVEINPAYVTLLRADGTRLARFSSVVSAPSPSPTGRS